MRHELVASVLSVVLAAASAPTAVWSQPVQGHDVQTITIRLSNFEYSPEHVRLRVGVPVRLHLTNDSDLGHDFSAKAFFAASAVTSGAVPPNGSVEVPGGGSVDITVVPHTPGTYKVRCTHFLHTFFGMTGSIVVEGQPP